MQGVSYRYPAAAAPSLDAIDLEIEHGEFVVVAGRSGSGKSTLLRIGCGLVPHFHGGEFTGEAVVCGLRLRESGPGELAAVAGYVAQDPESQVVSVTVRGELDLPLDLRGEAPAARARAVEEVALALAIPHLLDRTADTLSGGELQRVALAAALVSRAPLVLLDEPTSQLDPVAGDELISLLRRLNEEWGMTIVLCEHRLERCLGVADRVVALADARIAFDGPPPDFLAWAVENDATLATPGARMFHAAGLSPLPASVKSARAALPPELCRPMGAYDTSDAKVRTPGPSAGVPVGLEVVLDVRDLWVERDDGTGAREVLRGVDLQLRAGERVALMGRNGAGKSTLMDAVAGVIEPARGGFDLAGEVALLRQRPDDYLIHERVADEFKAGSSDSALEALELTDRADDHPHDLSGGERQRLALAIVLAGRGWPEGAAPPLVLLDEPTRGMDRAHKDRLGELGSRLARDGAAVLIATHDVEFAAAFADRVVLLGDGVVIADGDTAEVLSGGWYFATEVARILGAGGAILPEAGARALLGGRPEPEVLVGEARA